MGESKFGSNSSVLDDLFDPASTLHTLSSPPRRFSNPLPLHNGRLSGGGGGEGGHSIYGDRYIPNRNSTHLEYALDNLGQEDELLSDQQHIGIANPVENKNKARQVYLNNMIRSELLGFSNGSMKLDKGASTLQRHSSQGEYSSPSVLKYKSSIEERSTSFSRRSTSPSPSSFYKPLSPSSRLSYTDFKGKKRKISRVPYKVLDAPSLQDDFYLNLVDWSKSNILAVGLGSSVYLWSAYTSKVTRLHDFGVVAAENSDPNNNSTSDSVTSVCWMNGGTHLAIGLNSGGIQIWDIAKSQLVRNLAPHAARVGSLAWSQQSSLLASGSRDRQIFLQDVRIAEWYDKSATNLPITWSCPRPSFGGGSRGLFHQQDNPPYTSYSPLQTLSPHNVLVRGQAWMSRHAIGQSIFQNPLTEHIPTAHSIERQTTIFESESVLEPDSISVMPPSISDSISTRIDFDAVNFEIDEPISHSSSTCSSGSTGSSSTIRRKRTDTLDRIDSDDEDSKGDIFDILSSLHDAPQDDSICRDPCSSPSTLILDAPIIIDAPETRGFSTPPSQKPLHHMAPMSAPPLNWSKPISPGRSSSIVRELSSHKQEVCGLKWSFNDKQLASGGNDNKLCIWNVHGMKNDSSWKQRSSIFHNRVETTPEYKFDDHTAAVKAIAWSPHQYGLLASGGGTADKTIRFWNTLTGTCLQHVDTGSQVCNLVWSTHVNEIVSTHGYSLNQIAVWKYPSMEKVATLTGHTLRVLYLAMSPDGQSVVTGAGDETLRFWNIFPAGRGQWGQGAGLGLSASQNTQFLKNAGLDIR